MFCEYGGCMSKFSGCSLSKLISNAQKLSMYEGAELSIIAQGEFEDCAEIDVNGTKLLISTDFGPLIGDDAYIGGQIAALNAISDIYASGGIPQYAQVILSLDDSISNDIAEQLLAGVYASCAKEKVRIVGGHTIKGTECLIGLSVTSSPTNHILHKHGAKAGDKLWVSKPLGTGLIMRGYYNGLLSAKDANEAIIIMLKSNSDALIISNSYEIHSMTDVTGFGLIGHLSEMLGDGQGAIINLNAVPVIPTVLKLSSNIMHNNYIINNYKYVTDKCPLNIELDDIKITALFDPQTNGGLLFTTPPNIDFINGDYHCIGKIIDTHEILVI